MSHKCEFCNEKIAEDEMGKIEGTVIKVKDKENKNELHYICRECQKKGKTKEMLTKKK